MLAWWLGEPPKTLGFHVSLCVLVVEVGGLRFWIGYLQMAVEVDDAYWTVLAAEGQYERSRLDITRLTG
jgi:hypothetical protein